MPSSVGHEVLECASRAARDSDLPLLLAVSGGLDSMVLLDAFAAVAATRVAAVATFDHGTGAHATRAVRLVSREARRRGFAVVTDQLSDEAAWGRRNGLEALWRVARHRFLADAAKARGARVVTAHTRDDQIETILMRALRGSGARGLAGQAVASPIARPFLELRRSTLEAYARARGVSWVEDPSNGSRAFLRNRVRHDLLPALRRADPSIDETLWNIGTRAAQWRSEVEALVDAGIPFRQPDPATIIVPQAELARHGESSLAVLWGALAGRVGLALDRRGTHRCTTFTMTQPHRGAIPLAGGWMLEARGGAGELVLRRARPNDPGTSELPADGAVTWGEFRFSVAAEPGGADGWSAAIAGSAPIVVRRWRAGDRLASSGANGPRRVKRYLTEAGVTGSDREGWPVVEQGGKIVWIPGVRRSDAATARSGRPIRHYLCERANG
ncbi:MAG TPA: tRNA lysidine(34) synthetase TilS [Gemmatimonadaceae bacterium]